MKLTGKSSLVLCALLLSSEAYSAEFGTKQVPMTEVNGFVYCETGVDCNERTIKVLDVSEDAPLPRPVETKSEMLKQDEEAANKGISILFELASSQIKEDSLMRIKTFVTGIEKHQFIQVIGYTDRVGNQLFNKRLANDRAIAVKRALIGFGVKPGKIKVSSQCCIDSPPEFNPGARKVVLTLSDK